jgi:hypothetical protein
MDLDDDAPNVPLAVNSQGTGGPRPYVDDAERLARRQYASQLIAASMSRRNAVDLLCKKFGTTEQAAHNLVSDALAELRQQLADDLPYMAAQQHERLMKMTAEARAAKQYAAAFKGEELLMELHGTRKPEQLEVSVSHDVAEQVRKLLSAYSDSPAAMQQLIEQGRAVALLPAHQAADADFEPVQETTPAPPSKNSKQYRKRSEVNHPNERYGVAVRGRGHGAK